jgi:hypothetical protein
VLHADSSWHCGEAAIDPDAAVRTLADEARSRRPSIIVFDNLDVVFPAVDDGTLDASLSGLLLAVVKLLQQRLQQVVIVGVCRDAAAVHPVRIASPQVVSGYSAVSMCFVLLLLLLLLLLTACFCLYCLCCSYCLYCCC